MKKAKGIVFLHQHARTDDDFLGTIIGKVVNVSIEQDLHKYRCHPRQLSGHVSDLWEDMRVIFSRLKFVREEGLEIDFSDSTLQTTIRSVQIGHLIRESVKMPLGHELEVLVTVIQPCAHLRAASQLFNPSAVQAALIFVLWFPRYR